MGAKDSAAKRCLRNKDRFADLFNAIIFDGKQVIDSSNLHELDSTEVTIIPQIGKGIINFQKYRDILKEALIMQDDNNSYILLGIENQSVVHYAMPVRNMLYNAMTYEKQLHSMMKTRQTGLSNSEFLSNFTKDTKLHPVITITLYWGEETWDGPRTLKEMLISYPKEADNYIDDININLIELAGNTIYDKCTTDLEQLLYAMSISRNADKFNQLINNDKFTNVSADIANAISQYTNLKRPRRKTKGGGYNMCKAVAELEIKYQSIGADKAIINNIKILMKNTRKTFEEVCEMLDISNTDMLRYKNMM